MPYVAAAAAIAGMVISMAGARAQAKGQAKAAQYNAAVRERNAKNADIKADWRTLVNDIEEVDFRERFRKLQASTDVAFMKSGVQAGTGTAALVQLDSARQADEEIAMRDMVALTEAQQLREMGVNERLEAGLQRIYAKNYITAGRYKMAGAFARGVGGVAGAYGATGSSLMSSGVGSTQGGQGGAW